MSVAFFFYFTMWVYVFFEARHFNVLLAKEVNKAADDETSSGPISASVLENFRLHHGELCDLIGLGNGLVTHILGAFYGAGIPCVLFILHGFVYRWGF
jgi:hypothetical protein